MAKIKINIPAQSFEIEADFQPVIEVEIPKPEPLPIPEEKPEEPVNVKPPIIEVGIQNITNEWNEILDKGDTNFILSGGTYEVKAIKRQNVNREITLVGEDSTVIFGKENYNRWSDPAQDAQLFMLQDGADFYSLGINFVQPKQIKNVEPWMPTLFTSVQNPDARWRAVVKDCDTTKIGRHGGFGLGTLYGSNKGNLIAAINYKHLGNGFIEGKASIGDNQNGILKVYLKDVKTFGDNEEEFGSNRLKVTGYIKNNVFTITSDHSTQFLYNHFFNTDKGGNYSHILHLGRFTFMIDDVEAVLNDKQIELRPNANGQVRVVAKGGKLYTPRFESHAGDIVGTNVMIEKGRDEHPLWSNNFNPNGSEISYSPYLIPQNSYTNGEYILVWQSSFDQEGIEQEAYLISKGNDTFRTYPHTKFGESWEILRGQIVGHNMYNHAEITLYAENVIQKGYYRQTSRFGKSLGCFINNSEGFRDEFNPKVEVKSKIMTLNEFELL